MNACDVIANSCLLDLALPYVLPELDAPGRGPSRSADLPGCEPDSEPCEGDENQETEFGPEKRCEDNRLACRSACKQ